MKNYKNNHENLYLNIGCGDRFNRKWINIDINSVDESVIPCDISNGINFDDNYFDVVYHSHVIEHIEKNLAPGFLDECYRVLKPGGILRIAVPDLEKIAQIYLLSLENASNGKNGWDENYDWMLLELYDQVIRVKSGGEMEKYLLRKNIPNIDFIVGRCGDDVNSIIHSAKKFKGESYIPEKIRGGGLSKIYNRSKLFSKTCNARNWLLKFILGEEYKVFSEYKEKLTFQESGELHRWMYDRYSLSRLLTNSGFTGIRTFDAFESYIQDWDQQYLDSDEDRKIFKPDSLFIEGIKGVE
jgi:predicted SAM-dependent methyltransferase